MANLEYSVDFTGTWEKRPQCVNFCHYTTNSPDINGGTVAGGPQENFRSPIPVKQPQLWYSQMSASQHGYFQASHAEFFVLCFAETQQFPAISNWLLEGTAALLEIRLLSLSLSSMPHSQHVPLTTSALPYAS